MLESLSTDLALQPDNIVYLYCKAIPSLAVSYALMEAIFTDRTEVNCITPSAVHTKNVPAISFAPENLSVF
jgi:hypothetical protein